MRELVKKCYSVSMRLPVEERYNMTQQLRRAAVSVKLNLSEGSSRQSPVERKRFYEISRSSLVEIDSVLEIAVDLGYLDQRELQKLGITLNEVFAILTKMIQIQIPKK